MSIYFEENNNYCRDSVTILNITVIVEKLLHTEDTFCQNQYTTNDLNATNIGYI